MRNTSEKFKGLGEDILGAGLHLLSGAGGDLKLLVQQAVARLVAEHYVSRQEYDVLAARVAALEGKKPKKSADFPKAKPAPTKAKKPRK